MSEDDLADVLEAGCVIPVPFIDTVRSDSSGRAEVWFWEESIGLTVAWFRMVDRDPAKLKRVG